MCAKKRGNITAGDAQDWNVCGQQEVLSEMAGKDP